MFMFIFLGLRPICDEVRVWASNFVHFHLFIYRVFESFSISYFYFVIVSHLIVICRFCVRFVSCCVFRIYLRQMSFYLIMLQLIAFFFIINRIVLIMFRD